MTRLIGFITLLVFASFGGRIAHAVDVQRVVSPSGIEAWFVEDHSHPIVSVRFAFRGGAALDPQGKEGLAHMASALLDEGAGDLSSQAFQGRLEDLSISLSFSAGRDSFDGTMRTLRENVDEAFGLIGGALSQPRFDAGPVERIRSQLLAALRSDMEDPDSVASKALAARLYPNHPYGRPADGTMESIQAITIDDLRTFAKTRLGRDNVVIGVVGDVTSAELSALLEKAFGGLSAKAAPWAVADVDPLIDGKTHVIRKAVPQSSILMAQKGIARNHPDFYAAYVMNHILGSGGFTSRLYNEVREKRGLAYSVGAYLYPLDHSAMMLVSAGTANARTAETLQVVRNEWRKIAENGVTQAELDDAKTYLTGSFPLRFSASDRIARILVGMQLDDLGIDFLDRRNALVEAVTLNDVNRMARELLTPESLSAVIVGEPDGV